MSNQSGFPFSFATLDNQPFQVVATPDRSRAVLCLHGLGGGPYEMRPLAPLLLNLGWTVEAIAYPGHDQPGPKMPNSRWEDWYQAAETAFDRLAQSHAQVVVIGFSTGCPLALRLALQRSIGGLVLLSPFMAIVRPAAWLPSAEQLLPWVYPLLKEVPRSALAIADPEGRAAADRVAPYRSFHLGAVQSALALIQQVRPRLGEITVPTLIVQPKRDRVVNPQGALYLFESLGSSSKRLCWLEKSDHILTLDYDREQAFQEIATFFNQFPA
jgi:carboxylesterase